MLIIEIDHFHAEPLQARFARLHHIFRPPIHAVRPAGVLRLAELRRQDDAVPASFQRAADHLLIVTPTIHI